ncbi:hypothetical protein Aduo_008737 [Ancylostoma duodenale]
MQLPPSALENFPQPAVSPAPYAALSHASPNPGAPTCVHSAPSSALTSAGNAKGDTAELSGNHNLPFGLNIPAQAPNPFHTNSFNIPVDSSSAVSSSYVPMEVGKNNGPFTQCPVAYPSLKEQQLKLPSSELPEFNGDFEAFPEFWDIFNTAVHSNDTVPPSLKFLLLKSKLTGSAASIISEIKCTAQNYDKAITTLLATYDRPDILRQKFWDQLQVLPPSAGSARSQRTLVCRVRAIWAQLKNLKEQPGSTPLMRMILSKFPQRTRDKVGELRIKTMRGQQKNSFKLSTLLSLS